jgi:hypothetical protein
MSPPSILRRAVWLRTSRRLRLEKADVCVALQQIDRSLPGVVPYTMTRKLRLGVSTIIVLKRSRGWRIFVDTRLILVDVMNQPHCTEALCSDYARLASFPIECQKVASGRLS